MGPTDEPVTKLIEPAPATPAAPRFPLNEFTPLIVTVDPLMTA
jgi:hypothetical protein